MLSEERSFTICSTDLDLINGNEKVLATEFNIKMVGKMSVWQMI